MVRNSTFLCISKIASPECVLVGSHLVNCYKLASVE